MNSFEALKKYTKINNSINIDLLVLYKGVYYAVYITPCTKNLVIYVGRKRKIINLTKGYFSSETDILRVYGEEFILYLINYRISKYAEPVDVTGINLIRFNATNLAKFVMENNL